MASSNTIVLLWIHVNRFDDQRQTSLRAKFKIKIQWLAYEARWRIENERRKTHKWLHSSGAVGRATGEMAGWASDDRSGRAMDLEYFASRNTAVSDQLRWSTESPVLAIFF
jgi:hypothetical protein